MFYTGKRKKYIIADPGVGIRYISYDELTTAWANRIMLLLIPDEIRFYQQESDKIDGFKRLLTRILPYRSILTEAIVINLVMGLLALANPFLIQILTDDVLIQNDTHLLMSVALSAAIINIFSSTLKLVQTNLIAQFAQRFELGLILDFGRQILRLP